MADMIVLPAYVDGQMACPVGFTLSQVDGLCHSEPGAPLVRAVSRPALAYRALFNATFNSIGVAQDYVGMVVTRPPLPVGVRDIIVVELTGDAQAANSNEHRGRFEFFLNGSAAGDRIQPPFKFTMPGSYAFGVCARWVFASAEQQTLLIKGQLDAGDSGFSIGTTSDKRAVIALYGPIGMTCQITFAKSPGTVFTWEAV